MNMHVETPAPVPAAARAVPAPAAAVVRAADAAGRLIPPLWPLAATVAVNPFLGHIGDTLAQAAARVGRAGGARALMPRAWYRERIASGAVGAEDLAAALAACPAPGRPSDLGALMRALNAPGPAPEAVPSLADLAAAATGTDWPGLVEDRIGAFAAAHLDAGQALWSGAAAGRDGVWAAWRGWAAEDLTPALHGLPGLRTLVRDLPAEADAALAAMAARLGLPEAALEGYFHRLLFTVGGWAQAARYALWQAELAGRQDGTLTGLLAVRLAWEVALQECHGAEVAAGWQAALAAHAAPPAAGPEQIVEAIAQEAVERAGQRALAAALAAPGRPEAQDRPAVQAAFCIDVRSEVFRRALESLDPGIRTLGFAGFFGVLASHRGFASDVNELRLPVLLPPALHSVEGPEGADAADAALAARCRARAARAWGRFRGAAVSSFAFVEAAGPLYGARLLRDALGGAPADGAAARPPAPAPRLDPLPEAAALVDSAERVLRAMSLTGGFARLVVLAGHGASVTNNAHASALHCGACGGHSGEVNARLLAGLLNAPEVRAGLAARGIAVPEDTLFVAGLHDTTTDAVTLYDADAGAAAADHAEDLAQLRRWLDAAGGLARAERALRLPGAAGAGSVAARARDWAELRPEWGLAGCSAFIAAPRARTAGRDLGGRAFLHDYDWRQDEGFGVLELILTAPVVVASWISLQYYGSCVAPESFGAGNKLLHNVVGGIGVLEGNGGPLRAGLPWQSVHDGTEFVHEPKRLTVCVEAPAEAIADILARHPQVRELFDNRWLHLFAMDGAGRLAQRYAGGLGWEPAAL